MKKIFTYLICCAFSLQASFAQTIIDDGDEVIPIRSNNKSKTIQKETSKSVSLNFKSNKYFGVQATSQGEIVFKESYLILNIDSIYIFPKEGSLDDNYVKSIRISLKYWKNRSEGIWAIESTSEDIIVDKVINSKAIYNTETINLLLNYKPGKTISDYYGITLTIVGNDGVWYSHHNFKN